MSHDGAPKSEIWPGSREDARVALPIVRRGTLAIGMLAGVAVGADIAWHLAEHQEFIMTEDNTLASTLGLLAVSAGALSSRFLRRHAYPSEE